MYHQRKTRFVLIVIEKYDAIRDEIVPQTVKANPMEARRPLSYEMIECLRGCSGYPQYYHGRKAFEEGRCPFCLIDHRLNIPQYDQNGWTGWEVPERFTTRQPTLSLQFVFFPKRHIRAPWELTDEEALGRLRVLQWIHEKYAPTILGGGILNRFGDMRYNVGTIMHMHETVMVPNRQGAVILPLQKDLKTWAEHDERMQEFALRYEAGEIPT